MLGAWRPGLPQAKVYVPLTYGFVVRRHALQNQGGAHDDAGQDWFMLKFRQGQLHKGGVTGGSGRALCECGELSPVLGSGPSRIEWHRGHKREVADAIPKKWDYSKNH